MSEDPAALLNAYWLALGKFIHCFSMLEVALQYALWNKSGVDAPTAQALFSGVRAREALNMLKRLHEAEDNALAPELQRVAERFGVVMTVRNDIVHHGISIDDGQTVISSTERNLPGHGRQLPISPTVLDDLTTDVRTMTACINLFNARFSDLRPVELREALWSNSAQLPWRYKLP